MKRLMRLALIATPVVRGDAENRQAAAAGSPVSTSSLTGAADGSAVRERLADPDVRLGVRKLSPTLDLAEQLELIFEELPEDREVPILFYASCRVELSSEGEFFLCLDPANPQTGDALADIVGVFSDLSSAPVLFILECRHPASDDPFRSAAYVEAAKQAVDARRSGVELLIAARPIGEEGTVSAFTAAILAALDGADPSNGLTAEVLYDSIRQGEGLAGVPCYAHAAAERPFELVPGEEPERTLQATGGDDIHDTTPDHGFLAEAPISPPAREAVPLVGADAFEATPTDTMDLPPELVDTAAGVPVQEAETRQIPEVETEPVLPAAPSAVPEPTAPELPPAEEAPAPVPAAAEAAVPEAAVPDAAVPDAAVPEAAVPEAAVPDAAVPEAAVPDAAAIAPVPGTEPSDGQEDNEPTGTEHSYESQPPMSERTSVPPMALPDDRSFQSGREDELPRVIISEPPAPRESERPQPPTAAPSGPVSSPAESSPSPSIPAAPISLMPPGVSDEQALTVAEFIVAAEQCASASDDDGALVNYKKALGLGTALLHERAEIYIAVGSIKQRQGKPREAIANIEKGLQLSPEREDAVRALLELNIAARDWRSLSDIEEKILAGITDHERLYERLAEFGRRWHSDGESERALERLERAHALNSEDADILSRLIELNYEKGDEDRALEMRQQLAERTDDARTKAERFFALGKTWAARDEDDLALSRYEDALDADPTMLEPLAEIAQVLAERQEWSELESAYRRMLDRITSVEQSVVRTEVTFELCRRLGALFRDHLDDPALALDAFEDASAEKPDDLAVHLAAAELARSLDESDRARNHLQSATRLVEDDDQEIEVYHSLFEAFQRLRKPDQAYCAASVAHFLEAADDRERIVFQEHRPDGVPALRRPLRPEVLELLRDGNRNQRTEGILTAIAPAAIAARLDRLRAEGSLPTLNESKRQEVENSTIQAVRSFAWASHFLQIPVPSIYVTEDEGTSLVAVPNESPTTLAGGGALRGRNAVELAFMVGRHMAYHLEAHRLLLFYPSLESLSACFVAAVSIVLPNVPIPRKVQAAVSEIKPDLEGWLGDEERERLIEAVTAFDRAGSRADLGQWAASVEMFATRAGLLLCGDLQVAEKMLEEDPRGVLEIDEKITDLLSFVVSDEYHTIRDDIGIAIEP